MDLPVGSVNVNVAVLIKILLLLVINDILKHAAVPHMVAVNHVMETGKVSLILKIQINGSGHAFVSVDILVKIRFIVICMKDGIIDIGSGNGDPPHHIGIPLLKRIKIDGRNVPFRLRRLRFRICNGDGLCLLNFLGRACILFCPLLPDHKVCPHPHAACDNADGRDYPQKASVFSVQFVSLRFCVMERLPLPMIPGRRKPLFSTK